MKRTTFISMFLLANILFGGIYSCQSKNDTPPYEPPVAPEPPAWQGIPPMPPANSEDPTLLPTVEIPMPQGCGWDAGFTLDDRLHQTYFFINSYKELKELFYCGGVNDNIPTVNFNTYTMLGFVSDYGDTIIHQLRKESDSVYKWQIGIVEKGYRDGYLQSAILTPKLPQDSRIKISIDYKQVPEIQLPDLETYIEKYPVEGRTRINFIDKEKLAIIKNETSIAEFYYTINAEENTIELTYIADPSLGGGEIRKFYFKVINSNKFEIENLYPVAQVAINNKPLIMTFEKEYNK